MKTWNIGFSKWFDYQKWQEPFNSFESGKGDGEVLLSQIETQVAARWKEQHDLGLDSIPLNDFGLWDRVLETAWLFGLVPQKAYDLGDWVQAFFVLTRGDRSQGLPSLQRASWFKTGYHCLLPRWDGGKGLSLHTERIDWELDLQKKLPYPFHFCLLGPWTLSQLCELTSGNRSELLKEIIPLYNQLLRTLKKKGVQAVQIEEPGFCEDLEKSDIKQISDAYTALVKQSPSLILSTYYDSFDPWLSELCSLPVQGLHFDCVKGPAVLSWLKTRSFPKEKRLVLGLLDAQNIWASPLASVHKQLEILKGFHSEENIWLAPSAPLWHLPYSKQRETVLQKKAPLVFQSISFARERLEELMELKKIQMGSVSLKEVQKREDQSRASWEKIHFRHDGLRRELNQLDFSFRKRGSSSAKRQKLQKKKYLLPPLPVIFSPCSSGISLDQQVELGLDWLSAREETLNDLLEKTVSKMEGFEILQHGWIPFCGNTGLNRPLLVADALLLKKSQGNKEEKFNPRKKPTRAVVLGPASLLALSFCRQDLPWEELALQLAWATRQDVLRLEALGFEGVEIWEGEMSTGSPRKKQKMAVFQKHLLDIFKLASSGVKDESTILLNMGHLPIQGWEDFLSKSDVDTILFDSIPTKGIVIETNIGVGISHSKNLTPASETEIDLKIRKVCQVIPPHKLWILISPSEHQRSTRENHLVEEINNITSVTFKLRKLLQKN